MAVLAALAAVDLVVPFDADTPRDLIVACRPDVLVKGGDYTAATTAGAAGDHRARRPLRRDSVRVRSLDHRARAPDPTTEDAAGTLTPRTQLARQMSCRARCARLRAAMTIALLLLPDFLLIAAGAALKRAARLRRGLLDRRRAPRLLRAVPGAAVPLARDLAARARATPAAWRRSGSRSRSPACCSRRSRSRCSACRTRRSRRASSAASASTPTSRSRSASRIGGDAGARRDQPAHRRARAGRQRRGRRHARARARAARRRRSSRAIRSCSRAPPASRGRSPALPLPAVAAHILELLASAALPLGPACRRRRARRSRAATLPPAGACLVERRQARRAAGGRARCCEPSPGCRRSSGRSRS